MKKIMVDQKNKVLSVNFSGLNAKKIEGLSNKELLKYLATTLGVKLYDRPKIKKPYVNQKKIQVSELDKKIDSRPPNYFLNIFKESFRLGQKKPLDSSIRYFGIEIECFLSLDALGIERSGPGETECYTCEGSGNLFYVHRESGYDIEHECQHCEGSGVIDSDDDEKNDDDIFSDIESKLKRDIKEKMIRGVDLKTDGSLSYDDDDYFPVEFTILVRQDDFSNLEKLCSLLSKYDAKVNTTCGLHVHIDQRGNTTKEVERLGFFLEKYLNVLSKMVPQSRRGNSYCKLQASFEDRYSAINLTAFEKYKTIEVRLHSGTTDFQKIKSWCLILKTLLEHEEKLSKPCGMKKFLKILGSKDEALKNYAVERIQKFSSHIDLDEEDGEII